MANEWYQQTSVNGYLLHEVGSAMQKEIRRGNAGDAMYWASELLEEVDDNPC
jgi:replication-associated recombination protein RarA